MKRPNADGPRPNPERAALAALLFASAVSAFSTGCQQTAHSTAPAISPSLPPSTDDTVATVPLPERTPFDDNPKLRAVFLEFYANGYGLAATDAEYASPGCLCEANGDARKYDAMAEGFFAGRKAGAEAYRAHQAASEKAGAKGGRLGRRLCEPINSSKP